MRTSSSSSVLRHILVVPFPITRARPARTIQFGVILAYADDDDDDDDDDEDSVACGEQ
jgi:hypothetical protein